MSLPKSDLSDRDAVDLLRVVARKWIEQPSAEAFIVYQKFQRHVIENHIDLPDWLSDEAGKEKPELVQSSRAALQAILDGDHDNAKGWILQELEDRENIHAQALDPVSLAILGATLVGCILAARVKKIGNVTFYEGIPKGLADVLKAAGGVISGKL